MFRTHGAQQLDLLLTADNVDQRDAVFLADALMWFALWLLAPAPVSPA
jgi:hypothetical protein